MITKVEVVEVTGKKQFANKEERNPSDNIIVDQKYIVVRTVHRKFRLKV